jgi:hypothetical protein
MLGELKDKKFYCSGFSTNICGHFPCCLEKCRMRHRKHPTPKQFEEEYGEEYPIDGAVYWRMGPVDVTGQIVSRTWKAGKLRQALYKNRDYVRSEPLQVVCACTPFGKPANDWRP